MVEELNKECERLYGKVNVNEATLENLMDERQLLQKRCTISANFLFLSYYHVFIIHFFPISFFESFFITTISSVLESEERAVKLRETNRILLTDLEKTQTTLNEIAQEHSHLLYLQEKKNSRK